jgi:hypothetical protein
MVKNTFSGSHEKRRTAVTIPAILGSATTVVGKVFLVSVHADHILQGARDTSFLMRLEFWYGNYYINVYSFFADHIVMTPRAMGSVSDIRVVAKNPEPGLCRRDGLQPTIDAQIKHHIPVGSPAVRLLTPSGQHDCPAQVKYRYVHAIEMG